MEESRFVTSVKTLVASSQSRRSALRGVGLGSLAAGILGAIGAPMSRAQNWQGTAPTPAQTPAAGGGVAAEAPAAATGGRFPGVTGGIAPFTMNLEAGAPTSTFPAGTIRWGSSTQLAVLQGIAIASERVQPNAVRELHWHLNANELSYVLNGQGRMGVFSTDGAGSTFDLQPGTITFVPEGFTHYIQNTGENELHIVLAFTHEQPETTDLSQALPSFPQHLLAQTFGVPDDDFPFLMTQGDGNIVPVAAPQSDIGVATPEVSASSPYTVQTDQVELHEFIGGGGTARPVSTSNIPLLAGITVYPLHIVPRGLREPHWHPNTSEFSYCVRGQGQIGLVAPDGSVQTFAIGPGSVAYIPNNWFHYIASVSDDPLELLVFFAGPAAAGPHIELSQTFGYFPPEVVAASLGVDPAAIAALPNRGDVFLAAPVAGE